MSPSHPEVIDLFCPQCGILVGAEVKASVIAEASYEHASEPHEGVHTEVRYDTALCRRCRGAFLVRREYTIVEGDCLRDPAERVLYLLKPLFRLITFLRRSAARMAKHTAHFTWACMTPAPSCVESASTDYAHRRRPKAEL